MSELGRTYREAEVEMQKAVRTHGRYSPEAGAARERLEALRSDRLLEEVAVYLPIEDRSVRYVRPHSGVVGETAQEVDRIQVYYQDEGFSSAEKSFADRVSHAAGRMAVNAPTSSKASLPADTLQRIGTFDPYRGVVRLDEGAEKLLASWLEKEEIPADELLTTEGAGKRRREMEEFLRARPLATLDHPTRRFVEQEVAKLGMKLR